MMIPQNTEDNSRWGTIGRRQVVSVANSKRKHAATCKKNKAKRKAKKNK